MTAAVGWSITHSMAPKRKATKPGKSARPEKPKPRKDDWDLFWERHKPRPNHIDPNAGFSYGTGAAGERGCLFETFGAEHEFVRKQPEANVFTLMDDGITVVPGWHFVNRLGYFVVEVPWTEAQRNRLYKLR